MDRKKKENKCRICQRVLPREQFFVNERGWLMGAVCKECTPEYRRGAYLAKGGYEAQIRSMRKYYTKRPWAKTLRQIQKRTGSKNYPRYYGIVKNNITLEELETLWHRDKAASMIIPSIDRIDPEGDYTFDNCRYLELAENAARARPADSFLV